MDGADILNSRLHNQFIFHPALNKPESIVEWLGAIQAQDYQGAKWAIALRSLSLTDEQIGDAFNKGKILRTHVMRPTWHFVTPKDIRWILNVTKKRVQKINSYYYRQFGLDEAIMQNCIHTIEKSLKEKNYLTREEIGKELITKVRLTKNIQLAVGHILMYAELEGIICSGPRRGKQFTYALLDEQVSQTNDLTMEESLAELTMRYFQSHGPATVKDFMWWSGLSAVDAKKGIELAKSKLNNETREGNTYWFTTSHISKKPESHMYVLPNYDEYIVGYTDRRFIFDTQHTTKLDARANPLFQNTIILNGEIIGTWKRELKKESVSFDATFFQSLQESENKLFNNAVSQYERYINKSIDYGLK